MKYYFRGDGREPKEIFSKGFKKRNWWKSAIKEQSPFVSSNAISLSSEITAAASFPLDHPIVKESYIYIVRDEKGKFFNLYGKSLQDQYMHGEYNKDRDIVTDLAWANEYVSTDNISSAQIIGAVKIQRKFCADEIISNPSQLSSFQMLQYFPNPNFKSELTRSEDLLVGKVKQEISSKAENYSNIPRKAHHKPMSESSSLFSKMREDKLEGTLGKLSIAEIEMIYAATKAKFIGKSKICGDKMSKFLQAIYKKTKPVSTGYPGMSLFGFSFSTLKSISKESSSQLQEDKSSDILINSFFSINNVFDEKSISTMPQHAIEKLFFSFQSLWEENNLAQLFGKEVDLQRQAIIKEHAEIFENNSPQLKSPKEEAENPISMLAH